jgi:hypothetical protein
MRPGPGQVQSKVDLDGNRYILHTGETRYRAPNPALAQPRLPAALERPGDFFGRRRRLATGFPAVHPYGDALTRPGWARRGVAGAGVPAAGAARWRAGGSLGPQTRHDALRRGTGARARQHPARTGVESSLDSPDLSRLADRRHALRLLHPGGVRRAAAVGG